MTFFNFHTGLQSIFIVLSHFFIFSVLPGVLKYKQVQTERKRTLYIACLSKQLSVIQTHPIHNTHTNHRLYIILITTYSQRDIS